MPGRNLRDVPDLLGRSQLATQRIQAGRTLLTLRGRFGLRAHPAA